MISFEHLKACLAIIMNYDAISSGYTPYFFLVSGALPGKAFVF